MAGDHTLGTIRGTIEIDYDGAGIVRAIRDTDKMKSSGDKLDKTSSKILGAFGKFAGGATKVAAAVSTAHTAISAVAGAISILGPLAAAGFAALPGVILAGGAALAVFKLSIAGVGDALKLAGGDSKKFEAGIKGLAPQAQKFARAFRTALPALKAVQQSMQNAFFKGSASQIGGVVKRITTLKGAATGVAGSLGQVVQNIVKFGTSSKSIAGIKTILAGVKGFLDQIKGSVGPLVQAFIGLAAQSGKFGESLGGKVASALQAFTGFLQKINVAELFQKALPIASSLGNILSTLGSIVGNLFSVFTVNGGETIGILGTLTTRLSEFLNSAQGQSALAAIGTALSAISTGAGQIFLALLNALAPALVALAPGVTALAGQITGLLVPAINFLNPLLTQLATFISQNIGWLGPLAGAVVAAAAAYKVYAAAATAVSAVQTVLQSKLLATIGAWVASAASTVATSAAMAANAVVTGTTAVAAWVANTAAMLANRAVGASIAILVGGQMVAAWLASTAAIVANRIAILAGQVAMIAVRVATIAWTAVQWALNAALSANPIGLVVLAIAALVAGLIYAYKNSETFRNIVNAVWAAIKTAIGAVVNWITGTIVPSLQRAWQQISSAAQTLYHLVLAAFNAIRSGIESANNTVRNIISVVWSAVVSIVRGAVNGVRSAVSAGFNAAKSVVTSVMNNIRNGVRVIWSAIVSIIRANINSIKAAINGIRAVINVIKNAFSSAKSAAQGQISALLGIVRAIPGRVSGALSGLGGILFSKGKALIQGFINGIKSMAGAVSGAAHSIVSSVTKYLPGSPAKVGPLSGRGYVYLRAQRFMQDFAKGMDKGAPVTIGAIKRNIAFPVSKGIPGAGLVRATPHGRASFPSTPSSSGGGSDSGGGTVTYQIGINGKVFTTLVVDAITGHPVQVAKAANAGNRTTKWAGSGRAIPASGRVKAF